MIVSLPRSPWFYRCLNGALALLLAWVVAGVFWQLFAPSPKPPAAAPAQIHTAGATLDMTPLTNLFGGGANAGAAAPSSLNYKLRGVIAAQGDAPAVAMFEVSGQPTLAVKTGTEVESGVRLVEVASDHALVDNRGRRERIDLDAKPAAQGILPATEAPPQPDGHLIAPAAQPEPPPPMTPPVPVAPPNEGKVPLPTSQATPANGQEQVLGADAVKSSLARVDTSKRMQGLADGKGGIAVADASSQPLAPLLGLRSGDVITAVNGSPLFQKGDISQVYGVFSRVPRAKLDIVRNGAPLTLYYRIQTQVKS